MYNLVYVYERSQARHEIKRMRPTDAFAGDARACVSAVTRNRHKDKSVSFIHYDYIHSLIYLMSFMLFINSYLHYKYLSTRYDIVSSSVCKGLFYKLL